ncbi:MAG: TIGR03936 family radical SAM-associated protein [Synergistes jonesii]|uniref:TIGR03936 family radical SAM-associated protein n=1 Tax=Synergistes jonesii TaxID=2754 RepID=UPI002A747D73|nr:TIGR03936 family radical SAM-associated protein [Synergistes jonesii]MDY2984088.1 TIGR03936 family radical SAM-associated protein [Synergistes jonesii]
MARIRILYEKKGLFTFVNHLDLPVVMSRAAKRAGLRQEFTTGFSPHPRISLAPPLTTGVEGLAEPADFWFDEWNEKSLFRWNAMLPKGLKILKYAEITDEKVLAKSIDAALYSFAGARAALGAEAREAVASEARRRGAIYRCDFDDGVVTLAAGELERCGAGPLVKALIAAEIVAGWGELRIARLTVGRWDEESKSVLPLI